MRTATLSLIMLAAMATGSPARADETLADLLKRAPDRANTLMFVDLKALHGSPLGVKGEWAKQHEQNFYGGLTGLPPSVQQLLACTYLDPSTVRRDWEVVLIAVDTALTPTQLARKLAGAPDATNPELIASPRNAYFTLLEPKLIGLRSPINRQEMVRWHRFAARSSQLAVSEYLQDAAKAAAGQHIFLAIDLADVLDGPGVRERAKKSKTLLGRNVDLDDLTKVLVTLKGVSLTVKASTDLEGELRVDFGTPTNVLASFCGSLMLEALENVGLAVDDMGKWVAKVEGNSVVLRGKFTEQGLRALLVPLTPAAFVPDSPGKNAPQDPKTSASLKYFRSVESLLKELQEGKNNKSHSRISFLYKQYAQKIDELPILNVDPDLLSYGASVSYAVREMANQAQLQGRTNTALSANIVEGVAQVPGAYNGYGGGWGWGYQYSVPGYEWQSNRQQMTNLMAQGNLSESARRHETWKNVNAYTTKVRQAMVAKYSIEF